MSKKEEKYLEHKIALVRATIAGGLMGIHISQDMGFKFEGQNIPPLTDRIMVEIEKDIRNVFKYAKKNK